MNIHNPLPLNEQPAYKALCCVECTPIARAVARRVMSLPMSAYLDSDSQGQIVDHIAALRGAC